MIACCSLIPVPVVVDCWLTPLEGVAGAPALELLRPPAICDGAAIRPWIRAIRIAVKGCTRRKCEFATKLLVDEEEV